MAEQKDRPVLLQVGPLLPALQDALAERHEILRLWEAPDQARLLNERGQEVGALVTSGVHGATRELMSALPGLKAVFSFGVGYDSIDIAAARDLGVVVSNTPGVLDDCVADTAFALLIDVARGISAADRFVRRGDWRSGKFPLTSRLAGKTCGIVGLGNIGKSIARRVQAFGMDVAYHGRHQQTDVPYQYHASLEELAKAADFLVLSLPGGPATDGLIDAGILAALGPRGYLINIARGSVVDEQALVEALQSGALGGAGLDVFADEPQVPEALLTLDNVVLTPHLGSGTRETRQAMADLVLANVERYFTDGTLVTPV